MEQKKILIVDDEATSRNLLAVCLKAENHVLLFAADGEKALQMAVEHRPDLIVLDVMLPGMNGYEVAKVIKGNRDLRNIPIVALTARTGNYDEDMAREAQCDDYITKPFKIGFLRERLSKYLSVG